MIRTSPLALPLLVSALLGAAGLGLLLGFAAGRRFGWAEALDLTRRLTRRNRP